MSRREIRVDQLIGKRVRDANDRVIGRIEELPAVIELREGADAEYVVREVHLGRHGWLEAIGGSLFAQRAAKHLGRLVPYEQIVVRWEQLDLSDPEHPRLRS